MLFLYASRETPSFKYSRSTQRKSSEAQSIPGWEVAAVAWVVAGAALPCPDHPPSINKLVTRTNALPTGNSIRKRVRSNKSGGIDIQILSIRCFAITRQQVPKCFLFFLRSIPSRCETLLRLDYSHLRQQRLFGPGCRCYYSRYRFFDYSRTARWWCHER